MDLNSAEDSNLVKAAAASAVVIICLAIGFGFALNRTLGLVGRSLTRGFIVVEHVDDLVDELDRLNVDQRALLATGGDRYSEGVAESVTGMLSHVSALQGLHFHDQALNLQIVRVSHSVNWVLDLVGQINDLQQLYGTQVAMALLDADGETSIQTAKMEAKQLKRLTTEHVMYRVRGERKLRSVLEVVF